MYIKRVIIEGFKSYKEQVVIVLNPQLNVIVGYNGAGKSNLFSAIDFVMNGDTFYARQTTRASLLHEGSGLKVQTAFVEIVLDNSDKSFPVDSDEVILRRVISLKKDQYYINRKSTTKKEALKLFEHLGFVVHNPYYIIKQGKVNELASASASQNLLCIKQVARVRISDSRCKKFLLQINEFLSAKLERLDRSGDTVRELKETLQLFCKELVEFQRLDREKRALTYALINRQLQTEKKILAEVQKNVEKINQSADTGKFNEARTKASQVAAKLYSIKEQISITREMENGARVQVAELRLETERLTKHLEELKASCDIRKEEKQHIQMKCEEAAIEMSKAQNDLEAVVRVFNELTLNKDDISKKMNRVKEHMDSLTTQYARSHQFSSKEERDKAIREELSVLNHKMRSVKESIDVGMVKIEELEQIEESRRKEAKEYNDRIVVLKEMENSLYALNREEKQLRIEKTALFNKRMGKEQELAALHKQYELDRNRLRSLASTAVLDGLESIQEVLKSFRQGDNTQQQVADEYYGLVIDNFTCSESVKIAVEVTAGGSLFHHIIGRDVVAKEILEAMNQRNLPGEVTFLPLQSLRLRPVSYPWLEKAVPLIDKLNFDEKFNKVYQKLFGSTLLCQTVDIAIELAGRHRVNCVTFDGDQASSHGWVMGGYVNPMRSRFKLYNARTAFFRQVKEIQTEIEHLQEELDQSEKAYNEVVSNVEKHTFKLEVFRRDSQKLSNGLANETLHDQSRLVRETQKSVENMSLLEKLTHRQKELTKELEEELPPREAFDQERYNSWNMELLQLEQQQAEILTHLNDIQAQKNLLDETVKYSPFNLLKKTLEELDLDDNETQMLQCEQELHMTKAHLSSTEKVLNEILDTLENLTKEEESKKAEYAKLKEEKNAARLEMERKLSQGTSLIEKLAECKVKVQGLERKISDLGSIPSGIGAYISWNTAMLFNELNEVQKRLKEYEGLYMVNVASLAELLKRVEEMLGLPAKLRVHIRSVLQTVDYLMQRQNQIVRVAYHKVRQYFQRTFRSLVPGGQGDLTLIEKSAYSLSASLSFEDDEDLAALDGVLVQVSFMEGKPLQDMRHLSTGQRSVVALVFIFALQQCNPSPFYIFDEVDHALDLQHRTALAQIISELKSHSQFLVSTFKPELLQHADQFIGVSYYNKQTRVGPCTKEGALQIIEDQQRADD